MSNPLKDIILKAIVQEITNLPKVDLEKIIVEKFNQIKDEILSTTKKDHTENDLQAYYKKLIDETFINNINRQKYQLIDIIKNDETEDGNYFAVFYNKQTETRLCRSLVDFHSNFKIVK